MLDHASTSKLDFSHPLNFQNLDGHVGKATDLAVQNFRTQRGDAVVGQVAEHSTRAIIAGFYAKAPLETPWADGKFITLTDTLPPGVTELAYSTSGGLGEDVDDGIVAPGSPPNIYMEDASATTVAKFHTVKHAFYITQQDIWESEVSGFNKLQVRGAAMRERHLVAVNKIIREGSTKYKIPGIATFPGIRRRISSVNWYTGSAADIFADVKACFGEFDASETEDPPPTLMVAPVQAVRHFQAQQFSTASTDKLIKEIQESFGIKVDKDFGMKAASSTAGPLALLLNPTPNAITVHTPLFMYMPMPRMTDSGAMLFEVWTRIAGVQVRDEDSIMAVEGPTWAL